jgi:hypothetical protein
MKQVETQAEYDAAMERIDEAVQRMRENRPNSTAIVEELGAAVAVPGERWKIDHANFRGWMADIGGYDEWMMEATGATGNLPDNLEAGYSALWRISVNGKTIFWVSLPSMRSGEVLPGQSIDIGPERVRIGQYTQDELDALVRQGYEKLLALAHSAPAPVA